MDKKIISRIVVALIIATLIIAGIYAYKNSSEETTGLDNTVGSDVVSEDQGVAQPDSQDLQASPATQAAVEDFVRENISTLSPEPAVLGGTFMVTNITFIDASTCLVDYEDGHIALTARVGFSDSGGELVEINSFEILNDEDETATGESCEDLCGNDNCEEVVCSAIGCPCAESAATCPIDCEETL